jgi:hypothetical protein
MEGSMKHTADHTPERAARTQAEMAKEQPSEFESQERREGRLAKTWTYFLQRKAEGIGVA